MKHIKRKEYYNKILATIDTETFYVSELERLNIPFSRHSCELKGTCPFPDRHLSGKDSVPSFTVNLLNGVYFCNSCGAKGNVHTFYCSIYNVSRQEAWEALGDALNIERPTDVDTRPDIDPGLPKKYHEALMALTGPIRLILSERRGITDETLKRFNIGWDGERVTIPIYNEFFELVNIRRYKWNSYEDSCKLTNYEDEIGDAYGEQRIYGIEHLYNPEVQSVLWCEGEWDRIISEQNGIPACTATAGAGNFVYGWFAILARKANIKLCYDNDAAGRLATAYFVANIDKKVMLETVSWPKELPEKCDPTDIFTKFKYTKEMFLALFEPISSQDVPQVSLAASADAKYAGQRIKVPVLIAGKEDSPYIYPKVVEASCSMGSADNERCTGCSFLNGKPRTLAFTAVNSTILKLINCDELAQYKTLRALMGIPSKCVGCDIKVKEYANIECLHFVPQATAKKNPFDHQAFVSRNGFAVGLNIPTNKRYSMVGYMHAHPTSQRTTYIFDEAIPEKDVLAELEITPEMHELLKIFQVGEGQTVSEKLAYIHADLERNVTYIWDRSKVALAVDFVYHSVLNFYFQEQYVKRGWCECLIIGDSGQAKTTVVERLMDHYRHGDMISGESAKRTGLLYSMQQSSSGNWTLVWGAMPLNDGGLLTVDELSGIAEEDLAKMSDVRSSGIVKVTGVVTAETTSRTRMIMISNPRNGRQLKAENYGAMAILKLFGKAEDVRRLDFAVGVASGEVDTSLVNRAISSMPTVPHVFTSDLCNMRVRWAWSRQPNQVIFSDEATARILEVAVKMGKKYSSRVPLVEPADQRIKIARLAVSLACMLYSTDDGTNVLVKPEHVDYIAGYLTSIYDSRALSYNRLSSDEFENSDTDDAAMSKLRNGFIGLAISNREPPELIKALYQLPYFSRNTLEDATGLDRDELKNLMQFLLSNSVIEKAGQDYRRTPMGLAFVEYMLTNPATADDIREIRRMQFSKSEV